jgi:hypothetical protein
VAWFNANYSRLLLQEKKGLLPMLVPIVVQGRQATDFSGSHIHGKIPILTIPVTPFPQFLVGRKRACIW